MMQNYYDTIQFTDGHQIVNMYDAAGQKYRSIIYTNIASAHSQQYDFANYSFETDSLYYRVTEYSGNIETYTTKDTATTARRRIFNSIGYNIDNTYYHYIKDHIGNICAVVSSMQDTAVQSTLYYASGVPLARSFGRDVQPYLYNGKEFIEAHGLNEYDSQARMYYAPIMRTTTMDPLCEKYYNISPYAWCGNNPVNVIDASGCDTAKVTYNAETNHWDIGKCILAEGNDVIIVTDKEGNATSYEFSEGEYGKRICSVRLESTEQQTLGMFYLSGEGIAGYSVEPAGKPDNAVQDDQPIETGIYSIGKGGGPKWTDWPRQYSASESNYLGFERAVCVHYAGNHEQRDGKWVLKEESVPAVVWTSKCMVVATNYKLGNYRGVYGYVYYNSLNSFQTALTVAKYAGATGYEVRSGNSNGRGNYYKCISNGYYGTIRIIK